uniref:Uncharacterized protein n=1 Tax=Timema bartmani TaxID=61472 RepID=A0A7R9I7E8_9NEOP|nr:unnamed protein product [Timema bartmani]
MKLRNKSTYIWRSIRVVKSLTPGIIVCSRSSPGVRAGEAIATEAMRSLPRGAGDQGRGADSQIVASSCAEQAAVQQLGG